MATSLASAYVQVIPTTKGISSTLANELSGSATQTGQSTGSKIASSIKGVLIGAGIGKALGTALNLGGELEQNLGGTEAVFGQFAGSIQQSASNAYKNMGLSASDYMATANKMGSLFQGSGVTQQKSLELTSAAMQRAADVASVMGVDTSTAMESIAGAAKGNFTMMDNLGVAMNATTLQAYALEKGINFDWNTASQAEKAELAMQMFMDRTSQYEGNFARESEQTFSGSFGSMKAAFQDFMAGMTTGADVGPLLDNLITTALSFGQNLVGALGNIISAIPGAITTLLQGIQTMLPTLLQTGGQLLQNLITGIAQNLPTIVLTAVNIITTLVTGLVGMLPTLIPVAINAIGILVSGLIQALPQIIRSGVEIINALVNGVIDMLPTLLPMALNVIMTIMNALLTNLPFILEAGIEVLMAVIDGVTKMIPQLIPLALQIIVKVASALLQNLPKILQVGIQLILRLLAGIVEAVPKIIGYLPSIIRSMVSAFKDFDWAGTGSAIISGILSGLKNAASSIINYMKEIGKQCLKSIKSFLGIGSPSRVMAKEVGQWIPAGIAEGIAAGAGVALSEVETTATDLVSAANGTLSRAQFNVAASGASGMGGATINVNVYGAQGQDVRQLADEVISRIEQKVNAQRMVNG